MKVLNSTSPKKDYLNGQWTSEKGFSFISHQWNAYAITIYLLDGKKGKIIIVVEKDVKQQELSDTGWEL